LTDATHSYTYVIMVELYVAIVALLLVLWLVPHAPARRLAISEEPPPPVDALAETKAFLLNRSALVLSLVYAWSSGGYVAWTSLFDDSIGGDPWSDEFIGSLTFASTVAYIIGGVIASILLDAFWRDRMKRMLLVSCGCGAACAVLLTLSVPSIFAARDRIVLDFGEGWLYLVFVGCGFWNGAATPVFYELAVEVSAPITEGVSGTTLSYFENVGALVVYQILGNAASSGGMNAVFSGGMCFATIALALVRGSPGDAYGALPPQDLVIDRVALNVNSDTDEVEAEEMATIPSSSPPQRSIARQDSTESFDGGNAPHARTAA
jgi:hypothetical protein